MAMMEAVRGLKCEISITLLNDRIRCIEGLGILHHNGPENSFYSQRFAAAKIPTEEAYT